MNVITQSPKTVSEQLIAVVHSMMKSSQGPILELTTKYDLTLSQLKILMILANSDEPLALHEIGGASGLSLPAAGRAVDALLRNDLVSRTEDPADRRVKRVALTANGDEATSRVADARLAAVEAAVKQLSDDQRSALGEALAPLIATIPQPDCKEASQ
ncbi:MAG: MarR family winged helix-turn-helix transcriptional regulator [Solirubrobacterales bacterium]